MKPKATFEPRKGLPDMLVVPECSGSYALIQGHSNTKGPSCYHSVQLRHHLTRDSLAKIAESNRLTSMTITPLHDIGIGLEPWMLTPAKEPTK